MRHTIPALAVLVASAAAVFAADPPKETPADPLPKGATARLGTERMRNTDGYGARLHPDGKRLIATVNGKLVLLDPATGDNLGAFGKGGNGMTISHLSADGSRAVSASFDGFTVWNTETGKALFQLKDRPDVYGESLHLSADGKFLAVGGVSRDENPDKEKDKDKKPKGVEVLVFDVDEKKEVARLAVAQNASAQLLLSGDGKRGVTWGSHNHPELKPGEEIDEENDPNTLLQFWDIEKKKVVGSGRLTTSYAVTTVAFAPTGDRVAASSGNGTVMLFDPATGKRVKELHGRRGVGQTLAFSGDGKTLAAAASDGSVQLWEVGSGKSLGVSGSPLGDDDLSLLSLVVVGADKAVAAAQVGNTLVVWEAPSGKLLSPTAGHRRAVSTIAFTADSELVTAGYNGEAYRWDTAGKKLGEVSFTTPGVTARTVAYTAMHNLPGSGLMVGDTTWGSLAVYDLATGAEKFTVPHQSYGEALVGASADGKRLVVGMSGGGGKKGRLCRLVVIDVATGTSTAEVAVGRGTLATLAVSPDGKLAGLFRQGFDDKEESTTTFVAVDLTAAKVTGEVTTKGFAAPHMAAAGDNATVLASTPDSDELAVYDLATGKKKKPFGGGKLVATEGPVFSPDGKRVAFATSPGGDKSEVLVYEYPGGKKLFSFKGHAKAVSALAFSKDGKLLASGSHDTTVLLWDVSKE